MNIDTNKVMELRNKGLTMWEISVEIAKNDCGVTDKEVVDKYLYSNNGVCDIVSRMESVSGNGGYDPDAVKSLATAVIKCAVDDYGGYYTAIMNMDEPKIDFKTATKCYWNSMDSEDEENQKFYGDILRWYDFTAKMALLEKYFNDECGGWMDFFENAVDGKQIIESIKDDAREGRWIKFHLMEFDTPEKAEAMRRKYAYARDKYMVVKHKKNKTHDRPYFTLVKIKETVE